MGERINNSVLQESPPTAQAKRVAAGNGVVPDISLDPETLRSFTKAKLSVVAQLRILREALKQRCSLSRFQACEELMAKLAEDRFTLAVLGQFKRGKSSLMNAIIGRELLPVGVLPLTSAVTVLRFGPKERLLIERKDISFIFPEEVPVSRLADYVTEKGNPSNRKQLKTATLELPLPFLRRGLEFVDTPGVGSAIEANTATTYSFLPQCDAVIFVTSVETPFTRVELEFLHDIRQHVQKIFFVINKTDLLNAAEREEALEFITRSIRDRMQTAEVKVFPVSSRSGLAARLAGDEAAFEASGLKPLQEALAQFLSGEKARVFLSRIADRALRLLEQEWVEIDLRKQATKISHSALHDKVETVNNHSRQNAAERENILQRLLQHVLAETDSAAALGLQGLLVESQKALLPQLERRLLRCGRLSIRAASERFAGHLLSLLQRQARRWLPAQAQRLTFAEDPTVLRELEELRRNFAAIPRSAIEAFGLKDNGNSDADVAIPPWQLDTSSELYPLPTQTWKPTVPRIRGLLPVSFARGWLSRIVMEQWPVWTESFRVGVTKLLHDAVERAFDKWANSVRNQGAEAGARVLAAVTGHKPVSKEPRLDASPLDSRWSEAALKSVRASLTGLRQDMLRLENSATRKTESADVAETCADGRHPPPADLFSPAASSRGETGEMRADKHRPHGSAARLPGSLPSPAVEPGASRAASPAPLPVTLPDPSSVETDLTADLQTRACPVCEHLARFAFEFFSKWQYALFSDEQAQRNFAVELGFCPLHTWQFEAISSPVGTSVGHARLIEEVSRLLAQAAQDPQKGHSPLQILRSSANCRVCQLQRQAEATYIRQLASFVQSAAGRQTYARSQGPCLRHLGLLLAASSGEGAANFLLTEAARHFEEMAEDMQSFGMKTESLRRTLRNRDEQDAYRRALIHLVGTKANCVPWNNDGEI
jgi:predicted GTPase